MKIGTRSVKEMTAKELKAEMRYLEWHMARYTRLNGRIEIDEKGNRQLIRGPYEKKDVIRWIDLRNEIKEKTGEKFGRLVVRPVWVRQEPPGSE